VGGGVVTLFAGLGLLVFSYVEAGIKMPDGKFCAGGGNFSSLPLI